jgi:hypothetical protein
VIFDITPASFTLKGILGLCKSAVQRFAQHIGEAARQQQGSSSVERHRTSIPLHEHHTPPRRRREV